MLSMLIISIILCLNVLNVIFVPVSYKNIIKMISNPNLNIYKGHIKHNLEILKFINSISVLIGECNFFITIGICLYMIKLDAKVEMLPIIILIISIANIYLGLYLEVTRSKDTEEDKEGIFDDLIYGYLIRKSVNTNKDVKVPDNVQQIISLCQKRYNQYSDKLDSPSLLENMYQLSTILLGFTENKENMAVANTFLLEKNNVAVLAAVTNVLSDDTKLEFIESPEGIESREVYIQCIEELIDGLEKEIKNYSKIQNKLLNSELIIDLTKAKNNEL